MDNNTDVNVEKTTTEKVEKETTQKTYTEQDIQNSFNAGVKKASTDWQKDEKYKEFIAWKKSSQNDSERISELETNNSTLTNENKLLKAQLELKDSDVKKEFAKFVTNEVLNLTNDGTTFENALKKYKEENPQFFGETVVKKVQSSPVLAGGTKPQTTNSIMNNLLRGNR